MAENLDPQKLAVLKQYLEQAANNDITVAGAIADVQDLQQTVDTVNVLNCDSTIPGRSLLTRDRLFLSDSGSNLLIHVSFKECVKIKSITFFADLTLRHKGEDEDQDKDKDKDKEEKDKEEKANENESKTNDNDDDDADDDSEDEEESEEEDNEEEEDDEDVMVPKQAIVFVNTSSLSFDDVESMIKTGQVMALNEKQVKSAAGHEVATKYVKYQNVKELTVTFLAYVYTLHVHICILYVFDMIYRYTLEHMTTLLRTRTP